jgi:hypothetical protein
VPSNGKTADVEEAITYVEWVHNISAYSQGISWLFLACFGAGSGCGHGGICWSPSHGMSPALDKGSS